MANAELKGVVELEKDSHIGELHIYLEPTQTPRKFYIRISGEKLAQGRVRHRRLAKRLTDEAPPG